MLVYILDIAYTTNFYARIYLWIDSY